MAEIGFGAEGNEEAELVEGGKEITESASFSLSLFMLKSGRSRHTCNKIIAIHNPKL